MMDSSSLDNARKLFDETPSPCLMKYHGPIELEILLLNNRPKGKFSTASNIRTFLLLNPKP